MLCQQISDLSCYLNLKTHRWRYCCSSGLKRFSCAPFESASENDAFAGNFRCKFFHCEQVMQYLISFKLISFKLQAVFEFPSQQDSPKTAKNVSAYSIIDFVVNRSAAGFKPPVHDGMIYRTLQVKLVARSVANSVIYSFNGQSCSIRLMISSGSAMRPKPAPPQATRPDSGPINSPPRSFNSATLA